MQLVGAQICAPSVGHPSLLAYWRNLLKGTLGLHEVGAFVPHMLIC